MTSATIESPHTPPSVAEILRANWPVYLIEGALLGLFMVSACAFTAVFEYPTSPLHLAIPSAFVRRALIGIGMGLTAVGLIYCGWGKRSGAHMNPAITLCFLRLGKIRPVDAVFYVLAQFVGGAIGVLLPGFLAGSFIRHPAVNYLVTTPGPDGAFAAWIAEFVISFAMMATVLGMNRFPKLIKSTGIFAGMLVAIFITVEAPLSGMSMNPARTLGSGVVATYFAGLWIYFTAPILGMLTAVEIHRFLARDPQYLCGKLTHVHDAACILRCRCLQRHNTGDV